MCLLKVGNLIKVKNVPMIHFNQIDRASDYFIISFTIQE